MATKKILCIPDSIFEVPFHSDSINLHNPFDPHWLIEFFNPFLFSFFLPPKSIS